MSSEVYELFGYPLSDRGKNAQDTRRACECPFMKLQCDGGGNRYQSFPTLDKKREKPLVDFFKGRWENVPAGVCSLHAGGEVWIVCPRRLFTLERVASATDHEQFSANILKHHFGLQTGQRVGVWSEVKMKYSESSPEDSDDATEKNFDYTFDYLAVPLTSVKLKEASQRLELSERKLEKQAQELGFLLASRNGTTFIDDYPGGVPCVVEVMTSSTSGGNKRKGTTIQDAFKKSVFGEPHQAPGINYRQVWARMVSQLIVKSQIGKAWGGATLWILQDALTNYISRTTDLNLQKLISATIKEVNILSLAYSEQRNSDGTIALKNDHLFAGVIPPITGDTDFNKLLQAANIPPKQELERKLLSKKPRAKLSVK